MAPFTAWLPVRPDQDVDVIIKIVGSVASTLAKDWTCIAQSLTQKGLSVMTQQGRLNGEYGECVLDIRLATRPVYSMGHGCDVLVHLGRTAPDCRGLGLQPGSVVLWEPRSDKGPRPILPDGVIAYPIPLMDLCLRKGEGAIGKGLAALGALLHLLGVPETTLCRWSLLLSAPRSFAAGHDYARHDLEKRDAYSLPLTRPASSRALLWTPERAILLGYALSACDCRMACNTELLRSPGRWTTKHLDIAASTVSVLTSESHPGVQVYRGPAGKVLAVLRGTECEIASCLKGFKAPLVFAAADLPDAFNLVLTGHTLVRRGVSDGVAVLLEDRIARRHQSVLVSAVGGMLCHENAIVYGPDAPCHWAGGDARVEREGDSEAEVGFVAWGAMQGVVREAVALYRSFGFRVAGLYPKQIAPFQLKAIEVFADSVGRVALIESGEMQGYWNRLRKALSFEPVVLTPEPGHALTPMDLFLREGLGT